MTWLLRCLCRTLVLGVWTGFLACASVLAQDLQPVPALTARIMDTSATLSANDLGRIEQQLAALEQRSGAQVVVLLLPSTAPEDIFSYANRVANVWKIGRKTVGDGILIVVAVQDRRMRIEVAKTLEGAVPDLAARQIIEREMTPAFKRGDYAGGLTQAIEALGRRIAGENLPAPENAPAQDRSGQMGDQWMVLLIGLLVVSQVLRSLLGRGAGAVVSGVAGAGLAYVFTSSLFLALGAGVVTLLWTFMSGLTSNGLRAGRGRGGRMGGPWGGGGWGGGGGGGFSSGGGGDFGGGGAGGNW